MKLGFVWFKCYFDPQIKKKLIPLSIIVKHCKHTSVDRYLDINLWVQRVVFVVPVFFLGIFVKAK